MYKVLRVILSKTKGVRGNEVLITKCPGKSWSEHVLVSRRSRAAFQWDDLEQDWSGVHDAEGNVCPAPGDTLHCSPVFSSVESAVCSSQWPVSLQSTLSSMSSWTPAQSHHHHQLQWSTSRERLGWVMVSQWWPLLHDTLLQFILMLEARSTPHLLILSPSESWLWNMRPLCSNIWNKSSECWT